MKPIRKGKEIDWHTFDKCHDGVGVLQFKSLLDDCDPQVIRFMHNDEIKAGVSIGVHSHANDEEIYYLVSGKGILTYDDEEYDMEAGDISFCNKGHSHGFFATEDSVLIVVGC